jgi:hypothetical protein
MAPFPDEFDPDALLAAARAVDGLDDFGAEPFREPLGVLLAAYAEAPVHRVGAAILRSSVVRSLATRLRLEHWFAARLEIARERIEAPLVVVGMMRSGTTLVQRLLASDPRHLATLGWEVLTPAPSPAADPADARERVATAEARDRAGAAFSPEVFAIHPSYADAAEEEIVFLADAFLSHVPEASCDVPRYRAWLDAQDFAPAYRHLRRTLQLLQWQKRLRGERPGRWVLKTPAHLGYLELLFATFPDATVIHMHRDPVETIASGASLNRALWRMVSDDVDAKRVGAQWLERMVWTNGRALAYRREARDARFVDVGFREAVADPLATVARIYDATDIGFSSEARAAMEAWLARDARRKRPAHRYTPETFGLEADRIRTAFADYVARFVAPRDAA